MNKIQGATLFENLKLHIALILQYICI